MYLLILRPKAKKHLAKIPRKLQQRIVNSLKKLRENPLDHSLDIKKLSNTLKSYRLRVGELRIIYQMDTKIKEIIIVDIDFRRTTSY